MSTFAVTSATPPDPPGPLFSLSVCHLDRRRMETASTAVVPDSNIAARASSVATATAWRSHDSRGLT
jgi:hypothetical protein